MLYTIYQFSITNPKIFAKHKLSNNTRQILNIKSQMPNIQCRKSKVERKSQAVKYEDNLYENKKSTVKCPT